MFAYCESDPINFIDETAGAKTAIVATKVNTEAKSIFNSGLDQKRFSVMDCYVGKSIVNGYIVYTYTKLYGTKTLCQS